MIQLINVTHGFGARALFQDLTWQVDAHRRTALIGPNGAGKSTLLKILAGAITPDGGELRQPRDTTVGYLPQEVGELDGQTALDVVLQGRKDLLRMAARLKAIEAATAQAQGDVAALETLSAEHGELQSRYELLGGYTLEPRAIEVMTALGFGASDLARPPSEFSGGWRMRLLLSRLLLQSPDLLMLDEPTNHLDLMSMQWLEAFLNGYPGTIVMVSHDRAFLNRTVNAIASLTPRGLEVFPGNYDAYVAHRAQLAELLEKQAEQQAREVARTEAFIERFRAKATKAKQVQSRVKQLEKLERVETLDSRRVIRFRFPEAPRSGHVVVELRHVRKAYGDTVVYRDLNFRAYRGDRIALVGPNGAGKSTLLKILAGVIGFDGGDLQLGDRVQIGYFAQHQAEALDMDATVLDTLLRTEGVTSMTQARGALGAFLFGDESVDKPVRVLSGGEKNRLALARLLLAPPNLLVMDEPTNHLDLDSRDALEAALAGYNGCLIFISHDRHFIDAIASKVIHIEDGALTEYLGDFSDYEVKRRAELAAAEAARPAGGAGDAALPSSSRKERRRLLSELRTRRLNATAELRKSVKHLEQQVTTAEAALEALEATLADPDTYADADGARVAALGRDRAAAAERLDALMERWTEVQLKLETLDATFDAEEATIEEVSRG